MRRQHLCIFTIAFCLIISENSVHAASRRSSSLESNVKRLSDQFDLFNHEMTNADEEIDILKQKFSTLEEIVESLKRDVDSLKNDQNANLEVAKDRFQSKLNVTDGALKGFASDLKALKSHANEGTDTIQRQAKKISELENIVKSQDKKIDHLKSLLNTLLTTLDTDESSSDYTTYEVKFGDSLGLIAQKHGVKIKSIKQLNALTSDTIFTGQKLKIPKS